MVKLARTGGLLTLELPPLAFLQWQQQMCDGWFATDTHFVEHIVKRKLVMPAGVSDSHILRAYAVFCKYGVALAPGKCIVCSGAFKLNSCRGMLRWRCSSSGGKHPAAHVNCHGFLKHVPVGSWMPFLHFINCLRLGKNSKDITSEITAGYGNIKPHTLTAWKRLYQVCLGDALVVTGSLVVGTGGATVVVDETVVGVNREDGWSFQTKGVSKHGAKQTRLTAQGRTQKLVKLKVLKRLPARTVYRTQEIQSGTHTLVLKKPSGAAIQKKPSAVMFKKPAANMKNNGKWLWLAVEVGKGNVVYTHPNKTKKVTYRLLPRKADADEGKPRGLGEISDTLKTHVAKGAFLVHDGWLSTISAVASLGYRSAPPVKHDECYRDPLTGFHSNDAESENSRLKRWNRGRYRKLQLDKHEMDEYVYYINIGGGMGAVMNGLAMANGGAAVNRTLR